MVVVVMVMVVMMAVVMMVAMVVMTQTQHIVTDTVDNPSRC